MDEFELNQLRKNPHWCAVIERYHHQAVSLRAQTADFDGWVPRLHEVTDVPSDELPAIHGRLIAFGFLKFDLAGRDAGIRYQLTPLARQAICQPSETDASEASEEGNEAA